jgi:hypothetical protein
MPGWTCTGTHQLINLICTLQCEVLGRELVAARQAKERTEAELRQQV